MASIIKLKRSSTASAVPADQALQAGELAINLADKKLYSANSSGNTIQLSGDDFTIGTTANTDNGTIALTGTGNGSNSSLTITGANGIGITSDGSGAITVTANTVDVDFATAANTSSANLVVGTGDGNDVVKLSGNNGLVVAATNTTNIVVENKGSQHTVTVNGSNKFVIDGTAQQDLRLVPGVIYWFDQSDNSNSNHPLAFGTAANGSEVSQGTASGFTIYEQVGTAGSAGAYTRVQLQQDAPNHLYYFCENHSGMGADVYVQPDNLYGNATHTVATQQLDVAGNTNLGDSLTVADGLTISASGATITGAVDITGAANVSSTLGVDGVVDIDDTTESANVESGSLITAGGVGIAKSASIGETLRVTGVGTFSNNVTIAGDLTVSGTTTTVSSTTVTINDNMLSLADNSTATDSVDTGFYGTFGNSTATEFFGVFRDQSANTIVAVNGLSSEPGDTASFTASDLAQFDAVIDGGTY